MNIDHELRDALRRKEAPRDLAERVLERITEAPAPPSRRPAQTSGIRRWLAAAAVFAIAVTGAGRYYSSLQREAEAARVQEEIRIALQITSETLAVVQSKLSRPAEDSGR